MDTLVVNLFAGAGAGKSTVAAELFALLKWRGVEAELVTEYAKDLVWEKSFHRLAYQIGLFAEQHKRIHRVVGQVEVAIVDSPLLLSLAYTDTDDTAFRTFVLSEHRKLNNLNIFLKRNRNKDRFATTSLFSGAKNNLRALETDGKIITALANNDIGYHGMAVEPVKTAEKISVLIGKLYNK